MTATTHPEFNDTTEALVVAQAFPQAISGKTVLVTGVNHGGIGFTTSEAFASQGPAHLIIAGRNSSKIQECVDALQQEYPNVDYRTLNLDLSSQKAVRAAATEVLSWPDIPEIDIVVNNAAVMNLPERQLSEEGIELHFATNHIGHFLFTNLILPKIAKAAEGNPKGVTRVVNVTSLSPTVAGIRWSDINFEIINKNLPQDEQPSYEMLKGFGAVDPENKAYVPIEGYNQSKAGNLLFSIAANARLYDKYGILSLAVHPGVIQTELSRHVGTRSREEIQEFLDSVEGILGTTRVKTLGAGAATTLVAATDPGLKRPLSKTDDGKENFGAYFIDCQISGRASPRASGSGEAERLWKLSEKLVGQEFEW